MDLKDSWRCEKERGALTACRKTLRKAPVLGDVRGRYTDVETGRCPMTHLFSVICQVNVGLCGLLFNIRKILHCALITVELRWYCCTPENFGKGWQGSPAWNSWNFVIIIISSEWHIVLCMSLYNPEWLKALCWTTEQKQMNVEKMHLPHAGYVRQTDLQCQTNWHAVRKRE